MPQDTLEYPLQRDEVQTTPNKGERAHVPQSMFLSIYYLLFNFIFILNFYFKNLITKGSFSYIKVLFTVISPKPIDQEPESNFVGVIIAVLTTIILLLIVVILFIIARNKRSRRNDGLGGLQHNLHTEGLSLSVDKRQNSNIKVC